ncbi:MAG TPA: hypothetical protein PLA85_02230 [Micropepsaceae bacterium]|nr:hypothetical protein [Micropepsaceae bacterium]
MTGHLHQDMTHAFAGPDGAAIRARHGAMMVRAVEAARRLAGDAQHGLAAIVASARRRDDLAPAREAVARLANGADAVCLFGVGGSSLGAQAIAQFAGWRTPGTDGRINGLAFHAFDNLDAQSLKRALETLDLKRTRFLVVSKSGGTAETLLQSLAASHALKKAGLDPARHMLAITETTDNPLRRLATALGAPILEHDAGVGGRFAVLTLVGMVPAMLFGLNPEQLRAGAMAEWRAFETAAATSSAIVAAAHAAAAMESGAVHEFLMWPYGDRYERLAHWWRQLFAESIGKGGKGAAASCALGPVDQHSQLQLYLDGPPGRFITLIDGCSKGALALDEALAVKAGISLQKGEGPERLVAAQFRATAETLARRGRPVRILKPGAHNEEALGTLFMHFMLEVILTCSLASVDPFGQPAVEEGKALARKYLSEA